MICWLQSYIRLLEIVSNWVLKIDLPSCFQCLTTGPHMKNIFPDIHNCELYVYICYICFKLWELPLSLCLPPLWSPHWVVADNYWDPFFATEQLPGSGSQSIYKSSCETSSSHLFWAWQELLRFTGKRRVRKVTRIILASLMGTMSHLYRKA